MRCWMPCCPWACRTSPCRRHRSRCGRRSRARPPRPRRNKGERQMYDFGYHRPSSAADAAALLAKNGEAKVVAGGMTLLPTLKQRLAQPSDLVDLGGAADLKGIKLEGGGVTIGAM